MIYWRISDKTWKPRIGLELHRFIDDKNPWIVFHISAIRHHEESCDVDYQSGWFACSCNNPGFTAIYKKSNPEEWRWISKLDWKIGLWATPKIKTRFEILK